MDREAKLDLANRALHGVVNSVLQYMENATPFVPEGAEDDWAQVLAARDAEAAMAAEIHTLVGELDGVAKVGVFPYWNVDLNYLDLDWFCRFANQHNLTELERTERVLPDLRPDPKMHGLFSRLIVMRRGQAEVLARVGGEEETEEAAAPAADADE